MQGRAGHKKGLRGPRTEVRGPLAFERSGSLPGVVGGLSRRRRDCSVVVVDDGVVVVDVLW